MRATIIMLASAALLAGCSDDAPAGKPKDEGANSLKAGEYEVSAKVDALVSTDKSVPATPLKVGSPPKVSRVCVAADGKVDPAAFTAPGEKCVPGSSYMSGGRMSVQLQCTVSNGQITELVDGDFTVDSFTTKVVTSTYFAGAGDYQLTRSLTGKRVGDCPAKG